MLNHPNICTIYQVEEHDGQPFIVMELLEGESLRERISARADSPAEGERLPPLEQQLGIAIQIAEGLVAEHKRGIIHRDIKPAKDRFNCSSLWRESHGTSIPPAEA